MKKMIAVGVVALLSSVTRAEYRSVDMTVFGMDCAPCAHAVRVSMKGIRGVDSVDVDLNTGLVAIKLAAENTAGMRQIEEAIEKNGFTHKDATVLVRGKLAGSAAAPVLEVSGTTDRYPLVASGQAGDVAGMMGKVVDVEGVLPQASKGKIPDVLRYKSIAEVK